MDNVFQFLLLSPNPDLLYAGTYSPAWVVISVFLAILGCYAALRTAARIGHLNNALSQLNWILISGMTMGMGIWAMHFIGMLAFNLPCRVGYDPVVTLISIIPGILAANLALGVGWIGRKRLRPMMCSLLIGAGAATMHYTGMTAMHIDGFIRYDPPLFVLSIMSVVGLSYLALRINASRMRLSGYQRDALVAIVLGSAVSSVHYIGMLSAYFVRGDVSALPASILTPSNLAIIIALITVLIALGALTLASFSRNREITDQLRDSAKSVRLLLAEKETTLSNALVGIAHIKNRHIVSCNFRFEEMFHYDPGELTGQSTSLFYSSSSFYDKAGAEAYLKLAEEDGSTLELMMVRKDGTAFYGALNGKAIDPTDPDEGSIWVCSDITDRKHAEEEQRIAAIAFDSQQAMVITDANNIILRVNRAFTFSSGFTAEESLGQTPGILQSDRHSDDFYSAIWEQVKLVGSWNGEVWHRRKNDEIYPEWVNISAVKSESGIVTHYIETYTDISDSQRMRELGYASFDTEQRLSFALDAAQIGDWDMDLRTNVAVRSMQHDRCFGYSQPVAEWGYDTFLAHVYPADRERVDFVYKAALQGLGDYDVEFRVTWPDLSLHWLWSKGRFYFDDTGVACRVAGIQVEITERRMMAQRLLDLNESLEVRVKDRTHELELINAKLLYTIQQLEQTQHALVQSEKLAALGSMVAGVAHELNTPLGNALLILTTHEAQLVQLKNQFAAGGLSRKHFEAFLGDSQEMLQLANRALIASTKLVESFKQVARDQLSEERRKFDLADVINEILDALKPRFNTDPWNFKTDISADIRMDSFPGPLGQIMLSLVLNSIGHGFEGRDHGTVTILGRIDEDRRLVSVSVEDDGVGIAPDHIDRVFDPFFTTKLGRGGSGIGLNISQRLASKVLGGDLQVFSMPGKGSKFTLVIPVKAPETL